MDLFKKKVNKESVIDNGTIRLRGVVAEDWSNYKLASMFLITSSCNWKCCHEGNFDESVCQNNSLIKNTEIKAYKYESIYNLYINNSITKAIVIGGLEPFMQFDEIIGLIKYFRNNNCHDTFVIYTGYYPDEISDEIAELKQYNDIICKFGRFKIDENDEGVTDRLLGVHLASSNQFSEKIS